MKKKSKGPRGVTGYFDPEGIVDSRVPITWKTWCEQEMERMNSKRDTVSIVQRPSDGFIALVRG